MQALGRRCLAPEGPVDPVRDLGVAIDDEAGDTADEPPIKGDSAHHHIRRRPDLRHVDIECGAVVRILGSERGHPDRLGIPHLFEQGIEVGVVDRPQRDLSHKCPQIWSSTDQRGEHTSSIRRSLKIHIRERELAGLWEEVLGVDRIGADDNFFELGGDSMHAVAVVGRARERGFDFTVEALFRQPTVATLAADPGVTEPSESSAPVLPTDTNQFGLMSAADRAFLDLLPARPLPTEPQEVRS